MNLSNTFNKSDFLQHYWQQKPLVINNLIVPFVDPIDEHDLAGLAQEEGIDSRIVRIDSSGVWSMSHGPFDDFAAVCKDQWSLLVQATDRYFPDVSHLMELFRFVPYWRMDDVMISYSVTGAGVGAHVDQYDVFLVQGKGSRRWQVAQPDTSISEVDNNGIRQVSAFTPVIDVVMQPGDVLYIPPGWPHKGETIDNALTYSIGFRAPNAEQLSTTLCDALADSAIPNARYTDKAPRFGDSPTRINHEELSALKQQLIDTILAPEFDAVLVQSLSEQHLLIEEEDAIDTQSLLTIYEQGEHQLEKREGLRPILHTVESDKSALLAFINGEAYPLPLTLEDSCEALFTGQSIALFQDLPAAEKAVYLRAVEDWINKGYVYLT